MKFEESLMSALGYSLLFCIIVTAFRTSTGRRQSYLHCRLWVVGYSILAELCRRRDYLHLDSYFHCSMHIWVTLCNPWVYYQICIQRV